MKISVLADPDIPVPPAQYGGIERVIHLLVEGLVQRGHEVTLFAHRDSRVSAELVAYPRDFSRSAIDVTANAAQIARVLLRRRMDVIHSFGRIAALTPLAFTSARKFMSYQRPITEASIRQARVLFGDRLEFTACSAHMIEPVKHLGRWHVIYNAVPVDAYTFRPSVGDDAPLAFLGRLDVEKGAHLAIEVARRTGRRLILAGNVGNQREYFEQRVQPFVDGDRITYVGPVDDRQKSELLGRCAAFLMPILWDEPFGIVMAEALACGTPVIAFRRGSASEVVREGVTGWVVDDVDQMARAVGLVSSLDRAQCRHDAEVRFSAETIVTEYESLYRGVHAPVYVPGLASSLASEP